MARTGLLYQLIYYQIQHFGRYFTTVPERLRGKSLCNLRLSSHHLTARRVWRAGGDGETQEGEGCKLLLLRLVVECATAQTLDSQHRLDAPRRWGSSVCAVALNTSLLIPAHHPSVLTRDSSNLHNSPSVLKLDACCSANHELPVLRRRR